MEREGQVPTPGCPGLSHRLRGCSRFLTFVYLFEQQIEHTVKGSKKITIAHSQPLIDYYHFFLPL
jgi:hypothetical protein